MNDGIGVHADHEVIIGHVRQDYVQRRVERASLPPGDPVQLDDLDAVVLGRDHGCLVIVSAVVRHDDDPVGRACLRLDSLDRRADVILLVVGGQNNNNLRSAALKAAPHGRGRAVAAAGGHLTAWLAVRCGASLRRTPGGPGPRRRPCECHHGRVLSHARRREHVDRGRLIGCQMALRRPVGRRPPGPGQLHGRGNVLHQRGDRQQSL